MQQSTQADATQSVLSTLVGEDCEWCDDGTLARGEFKSDDAVVCEGCGTPAARVW